MGVSWFAYHSSTERRLGCFQFGVIMNKPAMNISIQVFVYDVDNLRGPWDPVFASNDQHSQM